MEHRLLEFVRSRVGSQISEILLDIPHCAYYQFSVESRAWLKSDLQGPLVIVKRSQEPSHMLAILSKRQAPDFLQPITADLQLEKKIPQFLLLQDQHKRVHGIWFPDLAMLEQVHSKVEEIKEAQSQSNLLKNLLAIGKDPLALRSNSPEFISEFENPALMQSSWKTYTPGYADADRGRKPQPPTRNVEPVFAQEVRPEAILKKEFLKNGLKLGEGDAKREALRKAIIALAYSDAFLDTVLQAMKTNGVV